MMSEENKNRNKDKGKQKNIQKNMIQRQKMSEIQSVQRKVNF